MLSIPITHLNNRTSQEYDLKLFKLKFMKLVYKIINSNIQKGIEDNKSTKLFYMKNYIIYGIK